MTMEDNLKLRNSTLGEVISLLEQYLDEVGPCDHSVNICSCHIRWTLDAFGRYCHHLTGGEVGWPRFRWDTDESDLEEQRASEELCAATDKELDMAAFARDLLTQSNVSRLSQLKAEADARAALPKGTTHAAP